MNSHPRNDQLQKRRTQKNFSDLFKHRSVYYGFAALWIVCFHGKFAIPAKGILYPLYLFQLFGACGVEIFLLLTGYGLYHSLKKNPNILNFYYKRLCRILLTVIPCETVFHFFPSSTPTIYLRRLLFSSHWYVHFILIAYAIFPLLYRLMKRSWKSVAVLLIASQLLVLFCDFGLHFSHEILRRLSRIPIFLLGCLLTSADDKHALHIPKYTGLISLIIFGLLVPVRIISIKYLSPVGYSIRSLCYLFLAVFIVDLLYTVSEIMIHSAFGRILYKAFAFCGSISLEIYIFQVNLGRLLSNVSWFDESTAALIKVDIASFILALFLGYLLHRFSDSFIKFTKGIVIPGSDTPAQS